jgi:hypothetical protein
MEKFDKLENKIDLITEKINSIDKTLDRNTVSLEVHIKRTNLLEEELKPIKSHVALMNNLAKIIVFLGILAAIYKNLK